MIADGREKAEHFEMSPPPAWAETWHLWTVQCRDDQFQESSFLDRYGGVEAAGGGNTRNLSSISPSRDQQLDQDSLETVRTNLVGAIAALHQFQYE
jgi:hypothetical protein